MCWPYIAKCPGIGYYDDAVKYCHRLISELDKFEVLKVSDACMPGDLHAQPHVTVCNRNDHTVSEYRMLGIARTIRKYDALVYHNGIETGKNGKLKQEWAVCDHCVVLVRTPLFGAILDNFDEDWATKDSGELAAKFEDVKAKVTTTDGTIDSGASMDSANREANTLDTIEVASRPSRSNRSAQLKRHADSISSASETTIPARSKRIRTLKVPRAQRQTEASPLDHRPVDGAAKAPALQNPTPTVSLAPQGLDLTGQLTALLDTEKSLRTQILNYKTQLQSNSVKHEVLVNQSAAIKGDVESQEKQLEDLRAKQSNMKQKIQKSEETDESIKDAYKRAESRHAQITTRVGAIRSLLNPEDDGNEDMDLDAWTSK